MRPPFRISRIRAYSILSDLKKTFPKIQFIASTHSPFIIQSHNPQNDRLLFLEDTDGFRLGNSELMGVEEIAENYQDVTQTRRSKHYYGQVESAETYLETVQAEGCLVGGQI